MEKITCRQVIPNEAIEKTPNIVGYAVDMMVKELTKELGNMLCDRKEYVVKMESPIIEDAIDFNSTGYKACIKYEPLVRCKECKYHNTHRCFMAFDMVATEDNGYCYMGEKMDDE